MLEGFKQPDVFAVTSQIFNYDQSKTREETGKTFGTLVFGCLHVGHTPPNELDERRGYVPVFYAGGGSSAYHRGIFLDLGGFNEIYYPGYVEDADLSYRAWKAGYRVLFCPASKVVHKHRSTNATKLGNRKIDYLIARNLFVLFWQNVTSPRLFFKHLVQLPLRILLDLSRGGLPSCGRSWERSSSFPELCGIARLPAAWHDFPTKRHWQPSTPGFSIDISM